MKTRTFALFALVAALAIDVPAHGETVTASKLKGSIVDCYGTAALDDDNPGELTTTDFGASPRTALKVQGRALYFEIGAKKCWVDRSDVEIDGLPPPNECVSNGKGLVTRGVGSEQKCK
jgi:hypothetical protein